jgi:hypothetical protein
MAISAALVDTLTRHQVLIQRLTAGEVAQFSPVLRKIDALIRVKLSGDELTAFGRSKLETLLSATERSMAVLQSAFAADLSKAVLEFAQHEAAFSAKALTDTIGFDASVPASSQVRSAVLARPLGVRGAGGGKLLDRFVADWSQSERDGVVGTIRRGVYEGRTNADLVRDIRGTKARNYADGVLSTTARHAQAVIHTSVQHASSVARNETFQANQDVVVGRRLIATLDSKTTVVCRSLDQTVWPLDSGPRSPLHINCRTTEVPELPDDLMALRQGATRPAIVDGKVQQVPANEAYYEWLKRQPMAFIETAIGPTRARLLANGGLSAERFAALQLDRNFQPLTLDEMKALEPLAFERASL